MKKIGVLIVDDSALIRQILTSALEMTNDIEVLGTAIDPFDAREKIKALQPDVITLDIEMPRMDGIAFLENLMRLRPMPVVMISTLTTKSSNVTLRALELGAIDFIAKPSADLNGDIGAFAKDVQEKIRMAASANVRHLQVPNANPEPLAIATKRSEAAATIDNKFRYIVAIGASTGGTEAIKEVLVRLPSKCPPILIAQHIPESFSASFAKRLNEICRINVVEAKHNQPIVPGTAYVAPGDNHLSVLQVDTQYFCKLDSKPKVNRHRPSVDVLLDSVTSVFKPNAAIGILLTGMGADGAEGLARMHQHGCFTMAQDEASSVVWGMPGSAVKLNGVDEILTLPKIADRLLIAPAKVRLRQ